ncbi:DUF4296 domain-containing protein [Mucilaginibacter terrenus]|uniref:DUF4296 domain-containing protein n=1 Tax=Mucilaginibacter terrenus TaxID=2482727 RepID=A0A3E2NVE0_9SPHI|nr:DUF4296 domain-containing protein [Mucilaginibacter terrenus]RFZ84881.1 DUF4296 domain-containing protein [Mucilaginibacter terrenus]
MHKHIIVFFSVLVFLSACKEDTPTGILSENRMVNVLTDMHIADGSLYVVPQIPDSLYKYGAEKYSALFKKHHITSGQFTASLRYYSKQPVQLTEMYDKIAANVKAKVDSLTKSNNSKVKNALPAQ